MEESVELIEELLAAGFVDDVLPLLAAADTFLLASSWEGLPRSVLEATAAGLPCVVRDTGWAQDVGFARSVTSLPSGASAGGPVIAAPVTACQRESVRLRVNCPMVVAALASTAMRYVVPAVASNVHSAPVCASPAPELSPATTSPVVDSAGSASGSVTGVSFSAATCTSVRAGTN